MRPIAAPRQRFFRSPIRAACPWSFTRACVGEPCCGAHRTTRRGLSCLAHRPGIDLLSSRRRSRLHSWRLRTARNWMRTCPCWKDLARWEAKSTRASPHMGAGCAGMLADSRNCRPGSVLSGALPKKRCCNELVGRAFQPDPVCSDSLKSEDVISQPGEADLQLSNPLSGHQRESWRAICLKLPSIKFQPRCQNDCKLPGDHYARCRSWLPKATRQYEGTVSRGRQSPGNVKAAFG